MVPESERVKNPHYVTLVISVLFVQCPEDARFDCALFVQTFLVLQDFCSYSSVFLMVMTLEYLTEGALADLLNYFIAICQVILWLSKDVFVLFVVKTVVQLLFILFDRPFLFRHIQVVYRLVLK